jgi:HAD superfamily hydrolase (TIGR01509 family)
VFDFDGLVVDTESAAYRAWQEVYESRGQALGLEEWSDAIGTLGGFDAGAHLERLTGLPLDQEAVERTWRKHELAGREPARPGVLEYLDDARCLGLRLAIASSDTFEWVDRHLRRLGLEERWDFVACADGDPSIAKPSPHLYLTALDAIGAGPHEAIALEDSPNGIRAAKLAGLFCVAVPNPVTVHLDLGEADLVVDSLAELPLEALLREVRQVSDSPIR